MKIGVFGDSFAASKGDYSWTNYLVDTYDCDFYARGGTATDWAYYHFRQCYTKYDLVIFFVSNLCRETVFAGDSTNVTPRHFFGAYEGDTEASNTFFMNTIPDDVQHYIDAKKRLWGLYPFNNYIAHSAMIDAVKAQRPDSILVHSFSQTVPYGLFNVSSIDIGKFGTINETPQRCNHMSPKQNEEFWSYLSRRIKDETFDLNMTLHKDNVSSFYSESDTLEQSGLRK